MTKFFEPIKASATHIYHSALELSPISSIVRKLYYDRCDRITQCPRVVIGTPDSWDPSVTFSGKRDHKSCAWSPCGQFIAAQAKKTVEIRNHLTFEILTVLQSTNDVPRLIGPPAYSPDGLSLACVFSNGVVIWDIQTGGVVKSFKCHGGVESLVWSLDGGKIAITSNSRGRSIETYDITSGAQLFAERSYTPHLWACNESFRFVIDSLRVNSTQRGDLRPEISISEIGPTLTKIESVSPNFPMDRPTVAAFSPSTSRVSITDRGAFRIMEIRKSNLLLEESRKFVSFQFSSDGNLFAASDLDHIRIWKYTSGRYTFWREFSFQYLPVSSQKTISLQFSPTSVSILSQRGNIVQVWPLDDSITPPNLHRPCKYAAIPPSGHYIAAAHGSTITIIEVHSQAPPCLVDAGAEIEGLVITGNVLLAASSEKVVAWLLTEEGAGDCDHIWTLPKPGCIFRVEGQVGAIYSHNALPSVYHTGTGKILGIFRIPQNFSHPSLSLTLPSNCQEYRYLRCTTPQSNVSPEHDWLISNTEIQEVGWIMDPQGRHRLWVPVEWRKPWKQENWHHDITMLFIRIGDGFLIVKF